MSARTAFRPAGWLWHVLVLLTLILLGAVLFGPVFWHPGQFLFSPIEDGIKNYYTALWYVHHDAAWWFTGMNYPFGEHVVYTDNQPLLAWVLAALQRHGVAVNVVAVFNTTMLLAQLLSAPPLLALLRRCRLPAWYAATVTVLIVLLAPQMERLLGHYALSYACVIPTLWYLVVRATEAGQKGRWYAVYALATLFFGCLHPYYFPISALLLLAYCAVTWWQLPDGWNWRRTLRFWLPVLITVAVPMALFQVALALSDPHAADRPSNPYGFFAYSSSVWSVFFPVEEPIRGWWKSIFHTPDPTWEGQAYVGLTGTFIALATLVRVGFRLVRRQWRRLQRPALPPVLRVSLWAALLILLFSMAWPFRWGLEGLVPYLGPIRQFRSLGRFAWIFYYIYSVYAAYALYQASRWLRLRQQPKWGLALLTTGLLLWAAEGLFSAGHKAYKIQHPQRGAGRMLPAAAAGSLTYPKHLAETNSQSVDYQAIIPIPYYALGSEVFSIFHSDSSSYESMRASLETGLPIAATMLSRTPLYQAQAIQQLLSHPAIDKPLLARLPDRRPFLLVVAANAPRDSAENALLARARILYRDSAVWLAELPLAQLEAREKYLADFQQQASLVAYSGYWASEPAPQVVHRSFDAPDAALAFPNNVAPLLGTGAQAVRRGGLLLANQPITQPGLYEASVWAYVRTEKLPTLHMSLLEAAGAVADSSVVETKYSTDILGDWVRLTARVQVRKPGQRLRVWVQGRKVVIDEFELRPVAATIWRHEPTKGTLVRNNYPLLAMPPFKPTK
ncbi:hypothetical protein [Hymenobacter jejuensis]|uniref:DUF6311 domain-containing protein n=1 Tax=Hymenobacter jejuensis TaxID=2502781 RepID=A0A5B7ZYN9_9BACT|nr:hypothetical protein [Hymenobacter jejuensis]QDA59949.1 hypothetical protein FHG12_07415 [Hymenobacter jejuensis]